MLIGDASSYNSDGSKPALTGTVRINYWDYKNSGQALPDGWPLYIKYLHNKSTNLLRADMHVDSTKENVVGKRDFFRQD
jgi:hypothetical protein